MLALTAGGASGLVAVTRELGGDERVVAVVQYLRVVLVTVSMPVVAAPYTGRPASAVSGPEAAGRRGTRAAARRWCAGPSASRWPGCCGSRQGLLGPMTVALVLTLTGVAGGAVPPSALVELAYAVIGWQAGVRFTRESLRVVAGCSPRPSR
jgi:uncharacterized membrane protein AbrB (regulator of aidB expression)